jgi:hypothetical protein
MLSKTMERALDIASERDEELKAAYERIKELEFLLSDLDEYFDGRADADCDQDGFIPNEEMKMLTRIRELIP